jgi:hypothetical protein
MKNQNLLFIFMATAFGSGCSSGLQKSEFHSTMQMQGSYSCPPHALKPAHPETAPEADTMRVRCYRDDWSIELNQVRFNRVLYNSFSCEKPIGRVIMTSTATIQTAQLDLQKGKCELLKISPDWIAEDAGKCMLQHLPVNQSSSLNPLEQCRSSLPDFCFESVPGIQLVSKDTSPIQQDLLVKATRSPDQEKCERYEESGAAR